MDKESIIQSKLNDELMQRIDKLEKKMKAVENLLYSQGVY
jgi:hypothetical protein